MDTTTNGVALAIVPQQATNASTALEPATAEQAFWLATQLVKSGVLGRSVQKPEAAFAIILAGRELGLTAMQSLRSCHVIEGKVVLSSDLMVALVKRSPVCKSFKLVESTNTVATYVADRVGEGETRMSFTIEDAKLAGVTGKNNWKTYPAAMLRARCIAALARVVFPDLLLGVYESDEIPQPSTMPSAREAGPSEPVEQPREEETTAADDEAVGYWSQRFSSATSLEEVKQLGEECKRVVTHRPTLLAISVHVNTAKERLKPETPKEN